MNAIYDLYQTIPIYNNHSPEYVEKMLHRIPRTTVVDRVAYLTRAAKDKIVLDIGATGQLSGLLQKTARVYHGTDIVPNKVIKNYYQIDLDEADKLPDIPGLELIIAGEVIEHLSNAGHFLKLLHAYGMRVILTTPNAYSIAGWSNIQKGFENVNKEHTCWYSYHTLKVLIERHHFRLVSWHWYNGKPLFAEGLIFEMEPE